MIESKLLLADLQRQVRLLEVNLAEQLTMLPSFEDPLREEHADQRRARCTAAEWPAWRDAQITQIAVAWVLGTVFLRWSEDNALIRPVLSGPGERLGLAEDAQLAHYRRNPKHNDGDWLAAQFDVLRDTDAGQMLFDGKHNPMEWLRISHDAAKALVAFWRSRDGEGRLIHDFTDPEWETRFVGDLYQDLSEEARKRYALLQTPRFIERFILDRTLTPAIDEFGLDGLRLIDPACGSGHFVLGAFHRLVAAWRDQSPNMDPYEIVRRSLASVHGVDINPFAVAIARFRLLVAALREAGLSTLADTTGKRWRLVLACTDSLRFAERQESFAEVDEAVGYRARWEDVDGFADERLLGSGSYHVVVGNPPYITVKDPEQSEYYRRRWSACHRQFQLTVPFAQRIFDLARRDAADGLGAGFTGQITSNAFMKREFGTKLIEDFFPTVDLNYVVDTSGAYIPGHGTPTLILIGRRSAPSRRSAVRAVLGVRGEPSPPADPEKGLVWTAIEAQVEEPGSESDWVSVVDLPRERLASHPWSLSGGGAEQVTAQLNDLQGRIELVRIGFYGDTHADEIFTLSESLGNRVQPAAVAARMSHRGDQARDWHFGGYDLAFHPYSHSREPVAGNQLSDKIKRYFWCWRTGLWARSTFGGGTYRSSGKGWWEWHQLPRDAEAHPWAIAFAFVATHNHFVLDRDGKVFNRSAPVIKLPAGASEDDHLALLGVLNSSTACFWMKQVCHDKGNRGEGGGITSAGWERFFEFTGTKLEHFPLPSDVNVSAGRHVDHLARRLSAATPAAVASADTPTRDTLDAAHATYEQVRVEMIAAQEELDWGVYCRYGLLSFDESAAVVPERSAEPLQPLNLGERAFEIVLARKAKAGEVETQWFARHGSAPITELPSHWPADYRDIVQARIELIEKRRDLALIERPECKRRWSTESWEKQQERALRGWLLDRLEARPLWFAIDANGDDQPAPHSVRSLADQVESDKDFVQVARLWATDALQRPDADLAEIVGALVDAEHVPFLAAYRYKPAGLAKRAEWEHTWNLQRQEDAIASRMGHDDVTHPAVRAAIAKEIGQVPVPPKYGSGDFLKSSYWAQRGKLDVPKERFVSYPGASRDGDGSLMLGWAGWDHREQAQALAILVAQRRGDDGWDAVRVAPLLAGLAEVLPWVRQWHAEIDPVFGATPGDIYDGFLDAELEELQLSRQQLADWRPDGRVNVAPLPRTPGARLAGSSRPTGAVRARRTPAPPDPAHVDDVLQAAAAGPLSNEQIRELTGLDTTAARALAQHLVTEGRLTTTGHRRGMRYLLP
ncbi:MAG: BREX-2 system adenine-specific DNA-methyltransferase PglX [Actinomycetota bacterium]|nr:BREX-2 system adenine-specific DNA-methyltransferase PglX [Actinomycetota bacterium]